MKSAENGVRFYVSNPLNGARDRRIFVQRPMRSHFIVVMRVASQSLTQMPLAKHNEMVDTLAADRPDQPFGESILPGRGRSDRLVSYTHGPS